MKHLVLLCLAISPGAVAAEPGEYLVHHDAEARSLSQELQMNAKASPDRFSGTKDVSKLPAWLIGSCDVGAIDYHLIAYFENRNSSYVALFRGDKKLRALWSFPHDARQFYIEGSRLMFVARPMLHQDTSESFAEVPRELVVDFATAGSQVSFTFHGQAYSLNNGA